MCVHPTKSGAQCKKNPELTLCGTHALNPQFTVVRGNINTFQGPADLITIGEHTALFMNDGRILLVNPDVPFEKAPEATPARKPAKHEIKCGTCVKNGVEHPYHKSINEVKICYGKRRRAEAEKMG